MKKYDAVVIGAGHNGLTNAAFLAKSGLDVLVLEKNDYIGGATVSRELQKGWQYSNCSYVCSLFRPEIYQALDLGRHGLEVVPLQGSATFKQNGDYSVATIKRQSDAVKFAGTPNGTPMPPSASMLI